MNTDPASLDNLHDILLPPGIPWWPPAPGWYVLFALLLLIAAWLAWRTWKGWQANGYRREALRRLASCEHAADIAELLRRTALAVAPRRLIAAKSGKDWIDWLAAQCPETMPDAVHSQLGIGVYSPSVPEHDPGLLRSYAEHWIKKHSQSGPDPHPIQTRTRTSKRKRL